MLTLQENELNVWDVSVREVGAQEDPDGDHSFGPDGGRCSGSGPVRASDGDWPQELSELYMLGVMSTPRRHKGKVDNVKTWTGSSHC